MTWTPPTVPTGTRINTTPQVNLHPGDHNQIHAALIDIINVLGSDPAFGFNDVTSAMAQLLADKLVPAGVALEYHGETPPAGWTFYNGQLILKTSAPLTWQRFQNRYGQSTTDSFYLPDRRLRVPIGLGAGDRTAAYAATLGQTGGDKDAKLIEHDHDVDPPEANISLVGGWAKWIQRLISGGGGTSILLNQSNYDGDKVLQVTPKVNIPSFKSAKAAVGEDGVDSNLPPYIVVNYIGRLV